MAEQTTTAAATADTKTAAATTDAGTTTTSATGAAATTTAAAATTTTAATTAATADTKTTAAATTDDAKPWADNWREHIAGGDEKELKQLARYQSPADLWKKARSLETRLSSGELKPALPKNAKPEEITAWRKDNGIPDAPDKYDIKGIEFPESDREIVDELLKGAHEDNFTPAQARRLVRSLYDIEGRNAAKRAEKDESDRMGTLDALAKEWGGKFSGYRARVENYLQMFPEAVRESIKSARLPDGTAMFNHPDVLRAIVSLSLKDIPDGVHVPNDGGDLGKSMLDRYAEIGKYRRENRGDYNKDAAVQEEERGLIEALLKQGLIDKNGTVITRKAA